MDRHFVPLVIALAACRTGGDGTDTDTDLPPTEDTDVASTDDTDVTPTDDTDETDLPVSLCPDAGSVAFTELRHGPLDSRMWIELRNVSGESITLSAGAVWTLESPDAEDAAVSDTLVIPTDIVVPDGEFLVIAKSGDAEVNDGVPYDLVATGVTYDKFEADEVALKCDDAVIDTISWPDAWEYASTCVGTLSLSSDHQTATDNDDWSNWCIDSSSNLPEFNSPGTPGVANLTCGSGS